MVGAVNEIGKKAECEIANAAHTRNIAAAAPFGESGSFCEVGAVCQCLDKLRDLAGIGGTVRIDHHDDVAGHGGKAACQRVSFSPSRLHHDADVWAQSPG